MIILLNISVTFTRLFINLILEEGIQVSILQAKFFIFMMKECLSIGIIFIREFRFPNIIIFNSRMGQRSWSLAAAHKLKIWDWF